MISARVRLQKKLEVEQARMEMIAKPFISPMWCSFIKRILKSKKGLCRHKFIHNRWAFADPLKEESKK